MSRISNARLRMATATSTSTITTIDLFCAHWCLVGERNSKIDRLSLPFLHWQFWRG